MLTVAPSGITNLMMLSLHPILAAHVMLTCSAGRMCWLCKDADRGTQMLAPGILEM